MERDKNVGVSDFNFLQSNFAFDACETTAVSEPVTRLVHLLDRTLLPLKPWQQREVVPSQKFLSYLWAEHSTEKSIRDPENFSGLRVTDTDEFPSRFTNSQGPRPIHFYSLIENTPSMLS